MALALLPALLYTTQQLESSDENAILQRLYDRDGQLLTALLEIQGTREDLLAQFARLDGIESRVQALNNIIDTIIASFYGDIDENGNVADNLAFFTQLIKDLKDNINSINAVSADIVRYSDVEAKVTPIAERLARLEDLDRLIQAKTDFIYGKWDVNASDDIFSV